MDLYAENILDHYRSPRGQKPLKNPTLEHREENASCGDELTIQLQIAAGHIKEISWSGTGCAISQAAMSMLSEELSGMDIHAAENLEPKNVHDLLGVPVGPRRTKCALLCLHTLKNAIRLHAKQKPQSWTETVGVEN